MPILAVALFGSRARRDENPSSDTDLLLITAEPPGRHTSVGSLSLSFYPIDDLSARARAGDLFLCHILKEGRALYDPEDHLSALRSTFRLRSSYAREIGHGADLGWLLVHFAGALPPSPLTGRRLAWGVRSILIGRSAEVGRPVFSAADLVSVAPIPETRRLIAQKDKSTVERSAIDDLRRFLTWCGLADPLPAARSPEDFAARFEATANAVGLQFLRRIQTGDDTTGYR